MLNRGILISRVRVVWSGFEEAVVQGLDAVADAFAATEAVMFEQVGELVDLGSELVELGGEFFDLGWGGFSQHGGKGDFPGAFGADEVKGEGVVFELDGGFVAVDFFR